MKRILYFLYYLKDMEWSKFFRFLSYSTFQSRRSNIYILTDCFFSILRYNISLFDYFYFRYFEKSKEERSTWAGTGFMYEYQLVMNPKKSRWVLEDKMAFNNKFNSLVNREYHNLKEIKDNPEVFDKLINNLPGKIVLKNSRGQAGQQIKIISGKEISQDDLVKIMRSGDFDLAEEYIIQHPEMMKLSPSGLNTVRIITQEIDGRIEYIAARLRISINSPVDNMAAGNAAAPVDIITGKVSGPAVFSDIAKEDIIKHPLTDVGIPDFQIPYWNEILNMVKNAALMTPENRSIGWDIAVTSSGPLLIEGNHNWCKLLWQLPVKRGLKKELEKYL